MTKILSITLISSAILLTACGTNVNTETITLSNQEKAVALLSSFETKDTQPLSYINSETYIQHNLMAADGIEGLQGLLSILPAKGVEVDVVRAFTDGDYVFTQTAYNLFEPQVGFDIFRFENGLIVEHWDNLQAKATQTNPSGRTQLDGSTDITDPEKTSANKALVENFVDAILVKGEFNKLSDFIEGENYRQHNTQIADGLSGLSDAFAYMASQGIVMRYTKNHQILGQGNFVLSVSEGMFAGKETSFYDLFRIENDKIVEHWDVIETIIPKSEWRNNNGKF